MITGLLCGAAVCALIRFIGPEDRFERIRNVAAAGLMACVLLLLGALCLVLVSWVYDHLSAWTGFSAFAIFWWSAFIAKINPHAVAFYKSLRVRTYSERIDAVIAKVKREREAAYRRADAQDFA